MIINRSFTPSPFVCKIPHSSHDVMLPFNLRDPRSSETLLSTWVFNLVLLIKSQVRVRH